MTLRGEDFTVARVKRRFGSQSHAGMLYTRRATHQSIIDPQHTAAADVTIATPDFIGGSTFDSGAWYVHTSKPQFISEDGELPEDGRSDSWGWHASVARTFRHRGVVQGSAARLQPGGRLHAAAELSQLESGIQLVAAFREPPLVSEACSWAPTRTSTPVLPTTSSIATSGFTPMELEFHSGDSVEFQMFKQTENLDEDFEISDGVILPAGNSYDWWRYQLGYDSAEQRMFSGRVEYSFGDFWDGKRQELSLDLNIRPRAGILIQLSSEFNDVDLPGGAFTTKLYGLDARTQFSPWISLSNNVQYDSESGEIGWQLRFRWIQKPGNDVFFIWTQNWREEDGSRLPHSIVEAQQKSSGRSDSEGPAPVPRSRLWLTCFHASRTIERFISSATGVNGPVLMWRLASMRILLVLSALLMVAANHAVMADNWPHWRGPNRNGASAETGLPVSWGAACKSEEAPGAPATPPAPSGRGGRGGAASGRRAGRLPRSRARSSTPRM